MALYGKLETETEIKAPADKFYKIFRSHAHHIPKICSDKIHKIELHDGDWDSLGSVKHWTYALEGTTMWVKEKVEAIDEEKKSITFNVVEGDLLKQYKNLKSTVQVTSKHEGSLVKWTLEYEKVSEDVPEPGAYIDLAISMTKDIDAHLLKA